jgi:hypothetical protein
MYNASSLRVRAFYYVRENSRFIQNRNSMFRIPSLFPSSGIDDSPFPSVMMTDKDSETLDLSSELTRLVAKEGFIKNSIIF